MLITVRINQHISHIDDIVNATTQFNWWYARVIKPNKQRLFHRDIYSIVISIFSKKVIVGTIDIIQMYIYSIYGTIARFSTNRLYT